MSKASQSIRNILYRYDHTNEFQNILSLIELSFFNIAYNFNCSSIGSCPPNQECVYINGNQQDGVCICPRGYSLSLDGSCKDIDECQLNQNICGPGAKCTNLLGSYKCSCSFGGDPYNEGCISDHFREGCFLDGDCALDEVCRDSKCINPCLEENSCGQNAMCTTRNHQKECNCRPLFFGDPYTICRKPFECVSDNNCPGNLKCLSDHNCGCDLGYERQLDYCISKTFCAYIKKCKLQFSILFPIFYHQFRNFDFLFINETMQRQSRMYLNKRKWILCLYARFSLNFSRRLRR